MAGTRGSNMTETNDSGGIAGPYCWSTHRESGLIGRSLFMSMDHKFSREINLEDPGLNLGRSSPRAEKQ